MPQQKAFFYVSLGICLGYVNWDLLGFFCPSAELFWNVLKISLSYCCFLSLFPSRLWWFSLATFIFVIQPSHSSLIVQTPICHRIWFKCFFFCTESGQPICGNGMVEPGEECDCGYSDQCRDQCCYDANQPDNKKCKLKPGKACR